jgi:hypothetical protein
VSAILVRRDQAVGRSLTVVLCLLTVFGPISMDLYLPYLVTICRRATTPPTDSGDRAPASAPAHEHDQTAHGVSPPGA